MIDADNLERINRRIARMADEGKIRHVKDRSAERRDAQQLDPKGESLTPKG